MKSEEGRVFAFTSPYLNEDLIAAAIVSGHQTLPSLGFQCGLHTRSSQGTYKSIVSDSDHWEVQLLGLACYHSLQHTDGQCWIILHNPINCLVWYIHTFYWFSSSRALILIHSLTQKDWSRISQQTTHQESTWQPDASDHCCRTPARRDLWVRLWLKGGRAIACPLHNKHTSQSAQSYHNWFDMTTWPQKTQIADSSLFLDIAKSFSRKH